jgi:TolB protein
MKAGVSASLKAPISRVPAWASTGFIAYKCGDSLCLIRPDGSGNRELLGAAHPWPQWDPAFSPDGQMVAFRGYYGAADGAYALYVVRADGCGTRRLTRSIAGNPSWSPDGKWIAFDRSGAGEIWKVRRDGSGLTRVAAGARTNRDSSPAWSPDGSRIAFVRYHLGHGQIWVMRADGSRATVVHKEAGDLRGPPAWSHDSSRIAFVVQRWPRSWIEAMDANGTHIRRLTKRGGEAWNPIWLPGDTGIGFLAGVNRAGSLFVMRPDGRDVHRVALRGAEQFTWVGKPLSRRRC